jgi:PAS domain S-box-containing protein/putative nucleotidyltransferase with HDIG domain
VLHPSTLDETLPPQPDQPHTTWQSQRERWVKDITQMMLIVILVAGILIFGFVLTGFFTLLDTLPIYILLVLILPVWWVARKGGYRWVAIFPALLCYGLGAYSSIANGYISIFVLFYAISILLAGMLISNRAGFMMVGLSTATFWFFGWAKSGFTVDDLTSVISLFFGLVAISLLQWYIHVRLQQGLEDQVRGNQVLREEIRQREQMKKILQQQEKQLRRLADYTTDLVAEITAEGKFNFASQSYRIVLGYDPQSMIGTNAFALIHPDEIQLVQKVALLSAENNQPKTMRMHLRHQDGHYIFMEVSGNPLRDERGELAGFILSSRDITLQNAAELAIQESEEKFRNIIEALPLGIHMYTYQTDGPLVFSGYNRAADTILAFDHSLVVGKSIEEAFPSLAETEIPHHYRQVASEGGVWNNEQVDYEDQTVRGAFEVHAFQTAPGHVVAIFADITERLRAAEELRLSEEKFSTAFRTSPDSININRLTDGVYIDINQGFTKMTGYTRQDVIGKSSLELNIWADPADRARLVRGLLDSGIVENLEAPFQSKNGSIIIALMSARVVTVHGEKCILSITRDLTERIQAEKDLREAHVQLEAAYDATLKGWARALELRERETAQHSQRVEELTLQIAAVFNLEPAILQDIRRGALLHDIGKMAIPDHILLKPGQLTVEEWVIMRRHPEFGRDMLAEIDYLRPVIDIPYCHHEKWDGSGYPNGLYGENIPLAARIFAVVDVYDALTHNRPYRPAWTDVEARKYLLEQSGKHFDPQIVDIFLKIV